MSHAEHDTTHDTDLDGDAVKLSLLSSCSAAAIAAALNKAGLNGFITTQVFIGEAQQKPSLAEK